MKPSEKIKKNFEKLFLETDWDECDSEWEETKTKMFLHIKSIIKYLDEDYQKKSKVKNVKN